MNDFARVVLVLSIQGLVEKLEKQGIVISYDSTSLDDATNEDLTALKDALHEIARLPSPRP